MKKRSTRSFVVLGTGATLGCVLAQLWFLSQVDPLLPPVLPTCPALALERESQKRSAAADAVLSTRLYSASDQDEANELLQRHFLAMFGRGWKGLFGYNSGDWTGGTHLSWEDNDWVKPPGVCSGLWKLAPVVDADATLYISRSHRFIFHKVRKCASTALVPYLECNYGAVLTREDEIPDDLWNEYVHIAAVREPVSRFISGLLEIYFRLRYQPDSVSTWFAESGESLLGLSGRAVAAYAHGNTTDEAKLQHMLAAGVAAAECPYHVSSLYKHLFSISRTIRVQSRPTPLHFLLHTETMTADLLALHSLLLGTNGTSTPTCPLQQRRIASLKLRPLPPTELVEELLTGRPDLLRRLCAVYIQDFLCFGYKLPPACLAAEEFSSVTA